VKIGTVYEDRWGAIVDRPEAGYIEIRWFDSTAAMTTAQFNTWLQTFADAVAQRPGRAVLVDSTVFRMDPKQFDPAWRDTNIIPRYNAAGVRRFAFLMPPGMPLIGKEPAKEGPAKFATGYFGMRQAALDWLMG
jgi:hypothetical protein